MLPRPPPLLAADPVGLVTGLALAVVLVFCEARAEPGLYIDVAVGNAC